MRRRIVITGLGIVSSLGTGVEDFWKALIAGESGISEISVFDTSEFNNHRGGEIRNFRAADFLSPDKARSLGRASCLAVASAKLALEDAGLSGKKINPEKTAVCCGTTMVETQVIEEINHAWVRQGVAAVDARLIPRYPAYVLANNISRELGLCGPSYVIPNACAAGNFAVAYGCDLLRAGEAEAVLAGGSDAFSRIAFIGFNRMFAVAPDKCQPFDKNRKGMMVAEGAAMAVLEPLECALKREARIYAEIAGYGLSCDAYHMTAPLAEGIRQALENALADAGIRPEEADYLNAHGTGTVLNDKEECAAIAGAFGAHARRLAVSSIKSMLGHTMGAASAIETAACCLALRYGVIPPTINFETPDPECPVDCVPNQARKAAVKIAINSASAFGVNNACLVLRKL